MGLNLVAMNDRITSFLRRALALPRCWWPLAAPASAGSTGGRAEAVLAEAERLLEPTAPRRQRPPSAAGAGP